MVMFEIVYNSDKMLELDPQNVELSSKNGGTVRKNTWLFQFHLLLMAKTAKGSQTKLDEEKTYINMKVFAHEKLCTK